MNLKYCMHHFTFLLLSQLLISCEESATLSNFTSKTHLWTECRVGGAPFRPADNKIIQRQLNLGPCLEKSPSIPIPFHPYLSFPFSAPHCCVINSQAPAGKSTFPLARSVAGTKHVLITNHNQERSTQVCQLYNVSDVPPVSSETLFSLCSGCTQHFKEVLKRFFCLCCHGALPYKPQVYTMNVARSLS